MAVLVMVVAVTCSCIAMQILLKELSSQKRIIDKLEDTIEALVKRSGRSWSPLIGRQQEILSMFIDIQASAREHREELLDRLNEVCHCHLLLRLRPISHCREYSQRTFVTSTRSERSWRVLAANTRSEFSFTLKRAQ